MKKDFLFTQNGEAVVNIAISENAQPPVAEAAAEFLETVRLLCGAKIGLQTFGKDERPAAGTVVLGTFCDFPFLRAEFSEDEKNLRESDGFSVRLSGGNLYIFPPRDNISLS